jgi:uncharacterized protein YcgL (UPF0745 family)
MKARLCSVYRCAKKEGMYVYVDKQEGLSRIPDVLQQQMGATELAMTLLLAPDKKLARVKAVDVLSTIEEQGFYLQMPPSLYDVNAEMQAMRDQNRKL